MRSNKVDGTCNTYMRFMILQVGKIVIVVHFISPPPKKKHPTFVWGLKDKGHFKKATILKIDILVNHYE